MNEGNKLKGYPRNADAMDKILEFAVANRDKIITPDLVKRDLFKENEIETIIFLFKEIKKFNSDIAEFDFEKYYYAIEANAITVRFLSGGGFKEMQKRDTVRIQEDEKKLKREDEKSELDLKLAKWQVKTFWPIFFIALIGGGFSIYNFIISLSPSTEMEIMQKDFKQLTSEIEVLKNQYIIKDSISKPEPPSGTSPNP